MSRRRALALTTLPIWLVQTYAIVHAGGVPVALKLLAATLGALTVVAPGAGLATLALLLPLASLPPLLTHAPFGGEETADLLAVPFLLAVTLRPLPLAVRSRLATPAALFGCVVVAATVVRMAAEQYTMMPAGAYLADLWRHVEDWYFVDPESWVTLHVCGTWLEGLGVAVAAERLLQQRGAAARFSVATWLIGCAGAAAFSVLRLVQVSLRQPHVWIAAVHFLRSLRVSPFYEDVNATGSFLVLALIPAIRVARSKSWRAAVLLVPILALALWLTGSRTALAAGLVGLLAAAGCARHPSAHRLVVGLVLAVLLLPVALWNPGRFQTTSAAAAEIRLDMARVGLAITRQAPWFGVGPGQFRRASIPFITPDLIRRFRSAAAGENAHNNYIQILAEYGLVGLASFLGLLGAGFGGFWTASSRGASPATAGLVGGVVAFLASCLAGHPLLTAQVSYLFLLAFGMAVGLVATRPPDDPPHDGRWGWRLVGAAAIGLALSVPFRAAAARRAVDESRPSSGLSDPVAGPDGVMVRVANPDSSWRVPDSAEAVTIPLRLTPDSPSSCLVAIAISGRAADAVRPTASAWLPLQLTVPPAEPGQVRRVEFHVTPRQCHLIVGPTVTRP